MNAHQPRLNAGTDAAIGGTTGSSHASEVCWASRSWRVNIRYGTHLTQPAVTQQVRALAQHFGVELVDVVGRRTLLTDAGTFLAARAQVLLGGAAALERDMREFADVRAGELRIGATVTIGTYTLPDPAARFARAFPAIRLRVEVENTRAMASAVKAGRVSLALVEGPLADETLTIEPYADDELVLVVPARHVFAQRRSVALRDCADVAFIFREEGSGTRTQVEAALGAAGVTPRVALTLPTGEGIVRAVERGIGVSILSRLVVGDAVQRGRVVCVRLRDADLRRTFRLVRPRQQTPSPAALAFAAPVHGRDRQ